MRRRARPRTRTATSLRFESRPLSEHAALLEVCPLLALLADSGPALQHHSCDCSMNPSVYNRCSILFETDPSGQSAVVREAVSS